MNTTLAISERNASGAGAGWLGMLRAGLSVHGTIWPLSLFAMYALIRMIPGKPMHLIVLAALLAPFWLWKIALVQRSLAELKTPNVDRATAGAVAALFAGTLLLAGLDALRLGDPPLDHAVRAIFVFALGASLATLRLETLGVCVFGYIGLLLVGRIVAPDNAQWVTQAFSPDAPAQTLIIGAAALVGCALWQWKRHMRPDSGSGDGMPLFSGNALRTLQDVEMTSAMSASRAARRLHGPEHPLRALRGWVGGGFAPISARRGSIAALVGAVGAAGVYLISQMPPPLAEPVSACLFVFALAMLPIGVWLQLHRLTRLMADASGERVELALLPGWGDADRARRLLMRATLLHLAIDGLLRGAVLGALTWLMGEAFGFGPVFHGAVAMGYVMIVALTMLAALAILGGGAFMHIPAFAMVLLILAVAFNVGMALAAATKILEHGWSLAAVVAAGALVAAALLRRRILRRPHAFLPG